MSQFKAGLVIPTLPDVHASLNLIQEADSLGVQTAWQTVGATRPDAVTLFGAAAVTTNTIKLGTSIVPTYTRHPAVLASQALVIGSLVPGRFRLGIGPSHRSTIETSLGIPMGKPLAHLREYITVLRGLLWEGAVNFRGEYFNVSLAHQSGTIPSRIDLLISALGVNAFRLAGEIADGAISWVAPVPYLVSTGLPALAEGAARANRAVPPLIAHVPVAVTTDRKEALEATARMFGDYGELPFYANMFAAAGFPVGGDGIAPPEAIESLAVSGNSDQIRARLEEILAEGIGEVLVSHVAISDAAAERTELMRILASR